MKKLYLLVIKSFIGPLVLTFFIVIFILLMQFLWRYIDDLIGKGLELKVIAEFLLYTSASLVPMAMPLAVLLASLMSFGNLAENLELLAFKSSGVSLFRIMAPITVLVTFLTAGAFVFSNNVLPVANLKMRSLLYDIQRQRPELQIKPGVFDNNLEGYSIRIGEKDQKTNLLKDIWIYDHTEKMGNVSVTVADSGYMKMSNDKKHLVLTLYHGYNYMEMQSSKKQRGQKSYPARRDRFSEQEIVIEMVGFGLNRTDENLFRNTNAMMNLSQLSHYADSMKTQISDLAVNLDNTITKGTIYKSKDNLKKIQTVRDTSGLAADTSVRELIRLNTDTLYSKLTLLEKRRALSQAINNARSMKTFISTNANLAVHKVARMRSYQIEKNRKYTLSLACLIFFFIGAPLGAIIRKGGLGMPVIVSVLFFLIYYVISITGEKFVRESITTPFLGMWASTYLIIPLGIFLTYKAANDSVIMNIETYFGIFRKIGERLKKSFGS
ncbi:MAG: LptF/LptG family permease [Bacteroidota bacterium]